jgi:hypothetical protein
MKDVTPIQGKSLGWRVVRVAKQKTPDGIFYFLQIEQKSKNRCEVHERKVLLDPATYEPLKTIGDDILPCSATYTSNKRLRTTTSEGGQQ